MKVLKSASINSENGIDISFVPPLIRRKLSLLDKVVLTTLVQVFDENVEEIIFSSEYGEFSRLYKKLNIPYYAISAGSNSLEAAKAIATKETVLVYADVYDGIKSIAYRLSPDGNNFWT